MSDYASGGYRGVKDRSSRRRLEARFSPTAIFTTWSTSSTDAGSSTTSRTIRVVTLPTKIITPTPSTLTSSTASIERASGIVSAANTTSGATTRSQSESTIKGGTLIGVVVATLLGIMLILGLLAFYLRKRNMKARAERTNMKYRPTPMVVLSKKHDRTGYGGSLSDVHSDSFMSEKNRRVPSMPPTTMYRDYHHELPPQLRIHAPMSQRRIQPFSDTDSPPSAERMDNESFWRSIDEEVEASKFHDGERHSSMAVSMNRFNDYPRLHSWAESEAPGLDDFPLPPIMPAAVSSMYNPSTTRPTR